MIRFAIVSNSNYSQCGVVVNVVQLSEVEFMDLIALNIPNI